MSHRSEAHANEQMHIHAIARATRQAQQAKTARRVSLDVRPARRTRSMQWLGTLACALVMSSPLLFQAAAQLLR